MMGVLYAIKLHIHLDEIDLSLAFVLFRNNELQRKEIIMPGSFDEPGLLQDVSSIGLGSARILAKRGIYQIKQLIQAVEDDAELKASNGKVVDRIRFDSENPEAYRRLQNIPQYPIVLDVDF